MARKLRIEFPRALYHVINRGNYRRDVFASEGAADAFVEALAECVARNQWKLYAYVVMRNHFHLVIETSEANLSLGMHWLLSTIATRFNRFRNERGHLFQGRAEPEGVRPSFATFRGQTLRKIRGNVRLSGA